MEIRLAQIRKEQNYSQQKLADAIGVNRSLISRWERGEVDPGMRRWALVARELGVTLDDLIAI